MNIYLVMGIFAVLTFLSFLPMFILCEKSIKEASIARRKNHFATKIGYILSMLTVFRRISCKDTICKTINNVLVFISSIKNSPFTTKFLEDTYKELKELQHDINKTGNQTSYSDQIIKGMDTCWCILKKSYL